MFCRKQSYHQDGAVYMLWCCHYFSDITNNLQAQATLLDGDISTCMVIDSPTSHQEFEWLQMEMWYKSSIELVISGHGLPCQLTACNNTFPVLLYHEEFSSTSCSGLSPHCSKYKRCELLSEDLSAVERIEQCSYRCMCNHTTEKNCQNFWILFDRKLSTSSMLPLEVCDIKANIVSI